MFNQKKKMNKHAYNIHFKISTGLLLCAILLINNHQYVFAAKRKHSTVNDRPIIGVLSQEISYKLNEKYPNAYGSYIAASYVKYLESAGARVVPIWIGESKSYYQDILSQVNGVLFPGGATYFTNSNGYADAGVTIYRIAEKLNKNGDYFPVWGTCLGFELMTYAAANRSEHRIKCSSQDQPLPLQFTKGFRQSRLFEHASDEVIKILENENVTINYHKYCVTKETLDNVHLTRKFRIMSTNKDWNNQKFVSTLEHRELPFYGVQFHPEKNVFEWSSKKRIPHSSAAIKVSQYFANFFVNEARKNHHSFKNEVEENKNLIYNYAVTFTGLKGSSFEQCYMFPKNNQRA